MTGCEITTVKDIHASGLAAAANRLLRAAVLGEGELPRNDVTVVEADLANDIGDEELPRLKQASEPGLAEVFTKVLDGGGSAGKRRLADRKTLGEQIYQILRRHDPFPSGYVVLEEH